MPEFTVKEVRLPELHLPEIRRDEIVRSLSGMRLPEVDLAKARRASIKIPAIRLSSSDVGRLLAVGAAVMRLVRPAPSRTSWLTGRFGRRSRSPVARIVQQRRRRSRWPIALGGIVVVVLAALAILRRPAVRQRIDEAARDARARIDDLRNDNRAMEVHAPVALASSDLTAGEIEGVATPTEDAGPVAGTSEHPDELGTSAGDTNDAPAFEETGTHS